MKYFLSESGRHEQQNAIQKPRSDSEKTMIKLGFEPVYISYGQDAPFTKHFKRYYELKKFSKQMKKGDFFLVQHPALRNTIFLKQFLNYLNNKEISILKESFLGEGNSPFSSDLKDKIIVDIGGNIGDTALQFAKQGAEVYSFEPVPPIYDIALKNIDLNPDLKDKIHFYNYAISNKKGEIDIAYGGEGTSAGSSTYSKKGKVYKVNTITLKDILSNLCPNVDLLQMDCEGSEYDIIPNSNLSMFKEIIIEYHQFITGIDYHVLLENLEKQGFIIDEIFPCPGEIFSINQVGIIRAINKNI